MKDACFLLLLIAATCCAFGCGTSESSIGIDIDSGSTNVEDIPKHINDFKDESENGLVQARAMYALIKIGKPAVAPLKEALKSDDVNVRLMSLNTLGSIGADATDALPAIRELLDDSDADVRIRAKETINELNEGS